VDGPTSSEPDKEVPGFVTHLAKHFSFVFWTNTIISASAGDNSRDHTLMSSCALAKAISERTPFITASFFAVISGRLAVGAVKNIRVRVAYLARNWTVMRI